VTPPHQSGVGYQTSGIKPDFVPHLSRDHRLGWDIGPFDNEYPAAGP
jgi:hypothetical protein